MSHRTVDYQGRKIVACDHCPRTHKTLRQLVGACHKPTCWAPMDAADERIIHRGGGWYRLAGTDELIQGWDAARQRLDQLYADVPPEPEPDPEPNDSEPTDPPVTKEADDE